jgi:hypothetical protein
MTETTATERPASFAPIPAEPGPASMLGWCPACDEPRPRCIAIHRESCTFAPGSVCPACGHRWPRGPVFYPDVRRGRPVFLSGVECAGTRALEAAGYDVGLLLQPGSGLRARASRYRLWAADNGCFRQGDAFDAHAWFRWVLTLPPPGARWGNHGMDFESRTTVPGRGDPEWRGCLFVVAPDVVADAARTWERSAPWFALVREAGYPVALVAQDGAEAFAPMWDECDSWDALFVGGSTGWKLSEDARSCVREAQLLAKWVHMGRVNSRRRLRLAAAWDLDSVDGTCLAYAPQANSARLGDWLAELAEDPTGVGRVGR